MEKSTPHWRLVVVRYLLGLGRIQASGTAMAHAKAMGMDFEGMIAVVEALRPVDFHKSMTTRLDHRIWQDVCKRPVTPPCYEQPLSARWTDRSSGAAAHRRRANAVRRSPG